MPANISGYTVDRNWVLIIVYMIDFRIDGTELNPLTRGTSASIGGSFERYVVSPITKKLLFIPSTVQISRSKGPRKIFLLLQALGVSNSFSR